MTCQSIISLFFSPHPRKKPSTSAAVIKRFVTQGKEKVTIEVFISSSWLYRTYIFYQKVDHICSFCYRRHVHFQDQEVRRYPFVSKTSFKFNSQVLLEVGRGQRHKLEDEPLFFTVSLLTLIHALNFQPIARGQQALHGGSTRSFDFFMNKQSIRQPIKFLAWAWHWTLFLSFFARRRSPSLLWWWWNKPLVRRKSSPLSSYCTIQLPVGTVPIIKISGV